MDPASQMLDHLISAAAKTAAGEAVFRASNMPRILACPGSVQLTARARLAGAAVEGDTDYNREGTALHLMAAEAIRGERAPEEWVGRFITAGDSDPKPVEITAEHAELVEFCAAVVSERWHPAMETHVEVSLTLAPLAPADPMMAQNRGTADVVMLDYANAYMHLVDHKFGGGIAVPADTPQIKDYAIMAMLKWPHPTGWKRIDTTIVQPRMHVESEQVKTATYDPTELMTDFLGQMLGAMAATLEPDPPLAFNKDCRFCAARAICPLGASRALELAQGAFGAVPMVPTANTPMPAPPKLYTLPDVNNATPADIARWLESEDVIESFFSGVKARALQLATAGVEIPGYKLTARSGNRKWRDPIEHNIAAALREMGVNAAAMWTEPKLKSPAQIEKLMAKEQRPLLETIVEKPPGAPYLVPVKARADANPVTPVFTAIPDSGVTAAA